MGVMIHETAAAVDTTPRRHRRHGLAALGLLTVASLGLSVLGIGTGEGPLGPTGPRGWYGVSAGRDVGEDLTEGGTVLTNRGWFTVHVESIRPLPVDDATKGLTITTRASPSRARGATGATRSPTARAWSATTWWSTHS